MQTITAYKLFRRMKDGTLAPLFIGKRKRLPTGVWLNAESIPTKGYAYRPGWHACLEPHAPHLRQGGDRVWARVTVDDYRTYARPAAQGGTWVLANRMRIEEVLL